MTERYAVSIVAPPGYLHSAAFQETAESIHHGLRALGHDSILTGETHIPGRRHVLLGANLLPHVKPALAADAILYNLEQVEEGSEWMSPAMLQLFRQHTTWDYSTRNIAQLRSAGVPGVIHVPIGYVPQLTRIVAEPETIDVLFIGSMNARRYHVLQQLKAAGIDVQAHFGLYGAARDALIGRARILLNLHFHEAKVFEIVRVSYLLANRRFVVSETGHATEDETPFANAVAFAAYEDLVETCRHYLARPDERTRIAAAGFDVMRARPMEVFLREALATGP